MFFGNRLDFVVRVPAFKRLHFAREAELISTLPSYLLCVLKVNLQNVKARDVHVVLGWLNEKYLAKAFTLGFNYASVDARE